MWQNIYKGKTQFRICLIRHDLRNFGRWSILNQIRNAGTLLLIWITRAWLLLTNGTNTFYEFLSQAANYYLCALTRRSGCKGLQAADCQQCHSIRWVDAELRLLCLQQYMYGN